MSDINARIQTRIEAFITQLNGLVRSAALDGVRVALGDGAQARASRGRAKAARRAAPSAASSGRGKGEKRSPRKLAQTVQRVLGWVNSHAGQGVEAMGKALGQPTKELSLPIKKLLASGKIRFTGVKRATKYYPRGKR